MFCRANATTYCKLLLDNRCRTETHSTCGSQTLNLAKNLPARWRPVNGKRLVWIITSRAARLSTRSRQSQMEPKKPLNLPLPVLRAGGVSRRCQCNQCHRRSLRTETLLQAVLAVVCSPFYAYSPTRSACPDELSM